MAVAVSIILPVLNETWSLEKTITVLMDENSQSVAEIVLVVHPHKTTPASLAAIERVKRCWPAVVKVTVQEQPFIGGALKKGFAAVTAPLTLMMACDGETDPHLVKTMLSELFRSQVDMVTASRWRAGGGFSAYGWRKMALNYIFQKVFGLLYWTSLSDMTYAFRLVRTDVIKRIVWTGVNHEIFLETLLKPLLMGCSITEIPARWEARREGESQIRVHYFFKYVWLGVCLRFQPVTSWLMD